MTRIEPGRMHAHVCARLTGILNMIETLEEDFQECLEEFKAQEFPDNKQGARERRDHILRLMKKSSAIRELRLDSQRMALQAGEDVAEWFARKNHERIMEADNVQ